MGSEVKKLVLVLRISLMWISSTLHKNSVPVETSVRTGNYGNKHTINLHWTETKGSIVYLSWWLHENQCPLHFTTNWRLLLTPKNVFFLRYKFFRVNRPQGQCFDDFVTELRRLSKECKFSNLQNSLIREMIVIEITDNYSRQRLLLESDLTLGSAVKLGHVCEETIKCTLELWQGFTRLN